MNFLYFKAMHSHLYNSKASISQITRKWHWVGDGIKAPASTMGRIESRRRSLSVTTEAFTDSHSGSSTAAEGGPCLRGDSVFVGLFLSRVYELLQIWCAVLHIPWLSKQHHGRWNGDTLVLRQSLAVSHIALQLMIFLRPCLLNCVIIGEHCCTWLSLVF